MTLTLGSAAARATPPDSPLARWDARWKLASVAGLILALTTLTQLGPLVTALAGSLIVAVVLGRLSPGPLLLRLAGLAAGLTPFLILLPLTVEDGSRAALRIGLRALAIAVLALTLIETTTLPRLFAAGSALGLPARVVWVMQLAFRYVFVLLGEARRLRTAARTRGFRLGTNRQTYRTLGQMAGALLVRGGERADQVAAAMRCRGFDGHFRTLTPFPARRADRLAAIGAALVALALLVWNYSLADGSA